MVDKTGDAGRASAALKLIPAFFVKVRVVQSVIFLYSVLSTILWFFFILFSVGHLKGFD
jgi:hypothetical protein